MRRVGEAQRAILSDSAPPGAVLARRCRQATPLSVRPRSWPELRRKGLAEVCVHRLAIDCLGHELTYRDGQRRRIGAMSFERVLNSVKDGHRGTRWLSVESSATTTCRPAVFTRQPVAEPITTAAATRIVPIIPSSTRAKAIVPSRRRRRMSLPRTSSISSIISTLNFLVTGA